MVRYSISDARESFADVLTEVSLGPVEITRHGKSVAVMIDPVLYNRLIEAAEDAEDVAAVDEALGTSQSTIPWADVKADLGLV
jgi:prevent-host-death family protein